MSLVKTSLLNGIAVIVKILSALMLNKVLAIYVGPSGYAIIGQFQNVVSILVSFSGGVLATGVTKATAQHFDNEAKQQAVWTASIVVRREAKELLGNFVKYCLRRNQTNEDSMIINIANNQ